MRNLRRGVWMWVLEVAGQRAPKPTGAGCMEKSGCSPFPICWAKEYDRYLASSKTMAAAYLDPNLNHTPSSSAKTHLSTGMERSPGAMERVLKVFHYFENSSEPTTWASIIRHGDATDVRGIIQKIVDSHKVKNVACYGLRLSHLQSEEVHWLHLDMGVSNVREKFELAHPPEEWKYELRIRYLPKGFLNQFTEDKPTLNFFYQQGTMEELCHGSWWTSMWYLLKCRTKSILNRSTQSTEQLCSFGM